MLARHAASASTRAPRVAPEPRLVVCRRASTTARCVSGGMPCSRRPPACRDGTVGPAPGRSRLRARSYHSRWAISVYGKEPGAPMREYEGYEREMAAFRAKGLAFDDAMVNDDPTLGEPGARRGAGASPPPRDADHLGNIEERWEEEDAVSYDEHDTRTDEEDEEDTDGATNDSSAKKDVFDDWGGRDVDANAAAANATEVQSGGSIRPSTPRGADSPYAPNSDPPLAPGLYLVGTPIGNLEDITLRALRVLRSADAVLAEDTRRTGRLLSRYGIRKRLVSYHAHNERARRDHLVARIAGGAALALVSDAGTPAVADPGADLAKACADAGLSVVPIPGPCAPAAAIVAAGALTEGNEPGFSFIGFLPPKTGARRTRWRKFSNAPGSVVAFVPPHKLVATLQDAAAELGEGRACVVCREMTKVRNVRRRESSPSREKRMRVFFFFRARFFLVFLVKARAPFTVSARVRERGESASGCDYTLNETIASERFIPTVASRGDTRSGDDTNHHQSMSLRFAERRRVARLRATRRFLFFF